MTLARLIVLVLSLMIASMGASWGQSQQPSPNPLPSQSNIDRRDAEQEPITIKIFTPKNAQTNIGNNESEVELTKATWALAICTLLLVIVAVGQLLLFWRQ